ncbi:FadR/GntR family transcriptional regulator [Acidisoma silvae]|uniref:FadR family transcriptional regulator n=1 Tax=Acidisoma silvae TaxID=2802396 RepID=A0A964E0T2_9PROT|nr:FadR/GntR family transcriptional regulator [Acidisoma silvae]MCB8877860.1 FadR family transcriptional regulator [Acidisoma silvae]
MSVSPLPQVARTSLVDSTIGLIRTQIESGAWKVGERIPKEQELADMMQVGRNTVREAIRVLSHANVLEVRQGDGTYVRLSVDPAEVMRRISRSSLGEHFEVRAMLETEAARLAALHRSTADIQTLRKLLKARGELRHHKTRESFVDADLAFHAAIARMSGNSALAELYRYFSGAGRTNAISVLDEQDLPEPDLKAHEAILTAIEEQMPERAAQAARSVIMPVVKTLLGKS